MSEEIEPRDRAASEALSNAWKQLLRLESVGADDNFFELGGNSMLAVRMLGAVSSQFGVRIDVAQFLRTPNIRTLSRLVVLGERLHAEPPAEGIRAKENRGRSDGGVF